MKQYHLSVLLIYISIFNIGLLSAKEQKNAIIYMGDGGRIGDKLKGYYKTKWLSYKYKIPFFYSPFGKKYLTSKQFKLHKIERPWSKKKKKRFKRHINLRKKHENEINFKPETPTLYQFSYYTTITDNLLIKKLDKKFYNEHKVFFDRIRKLIKPVARIKQISLPDNKITVAVHVRKGGGFDKPLLSRKPNYQYEDVKWPTKFPPDSYYIEQIKYLSDYFDDSPLHVHIFTDDKNPARIMNKYKKAISLPNITYSCRKKGNHHARNVLDDLFNMAYRFDCLIRPSSSFSYLAQLLGTHKLAIAPAKSVWQGNTLIITEASKFVNENV